MATDASEPVVRAQELRKEYGSTVAVDSISFEVRADEILALLGPNGAGKTVTVELLQGLRTPTSGGAEVLGLDVRDDPYKIKNRIGVVPQSFQTFERLTVRENVSLIRDLHTDPLDVGTVLEQLDLTEYADDRFHSLSGGYQRRTGIAMALVGDPELLFLDEPTTGLDPAARRATWEQIERLPGLGTAVVLTTHYMEEVEALADRVALLVDGRIEAVDTVPALIDAYAGEVKVVVRLDGTADATGDAVDLESLLAGTARTVYRDETGDLVGVFDDRQAAQEAFSDLHEAGTERPIDLVSAGMEDVFLELAGGRLDPAGELR